MVYFGRIWLILWIRHNVLVHTPTQNVRLPRSECAWSGICTCITYVCLDTWVMHVEKNLGSVIDRRLCCSHIRSYLSLFWAVTIMLCIFTIACLMCGSKSYSLTNCLHFRLCPLMTKSRVVGVKDMSAHSLATRGQQSPPPSEPEGLTD